jgi:hypothetical protein
MRFIDADSFDRWVKTGQRNKLLETKEAGE